MTNTFTPPRSGDTITYTRRDGTKATATALRVEDNLCWADYGEHGGIAPFIWRFKDGLNTVHEWPGKSA